MPIPGAPVGVAPAAPASPGLPVLYNYAEGFHHETIYWRSHRGYWDPSGPAAAPSVRLAASVLFALPAT